MKKRLTKDKIMGASTYILVTVAFLILQLLMSQGKLSSTMKGFLVPACAYIVLAISLNLLVGICGELSLGHAGFMGIGAFTGVIVTALLATAVPNGIVRLVIAMVVDYGTGMAKAWSAGELCSRTGIRGILKKVGYLVIVAVAMGADYLLRYGLDQVGVHINIEFLIAAIVIVWLIINELISILENVAAIGAPVPEFLLKLIEKLKTVTEKQAETVPVEAESQPEEAE